MAVHIKLLTLILSVCYILNLVNANKIVFCYWGTWAYYRPGNGKFEAANIDPNLCTHIGYTFFGITDDGEIRDLDSWLDVDLGNIEKTVALKQQNSNLKILASVGGWNEGSAKYSAMAADSTRRSRFVSSVINFLMKWHFDGLDLDWEYPGQRGGSATDRQNYITLLRDLKSALAGHNLLLTVAVAAAKPSASISYDVVNVAQNVDFINVMTYDFNGAWNNILGYNAPLYGDGPNTVNAAIEFWLQEGAPANKIVLGIPLYGRTFTLADMGQTTVGSRSSGPGLAGPYTREAGFLGYNEICEHISEWTKHWDEGQKVPYAHKDNQWVSYDNTQSIAEKINFLKSHNLAGAMVWSIETDDFRGTCGGGAYPLLKTIKQQLNENMNNIPTLPTSATSTSQSTKSTAAAPTIECRTDGMFVHPYDCSQFYRCVNGNRFDFQCPAGLKFDEKIQVCNWPHLVEC